jgi:DNA primase
VPGVDFGRVRSLVTMEQVLSLLGFEPANHSGSQWYGRCPLHEPGPERRRRSFSVNVAIGRYDCHGCHSHGNQLGVLPAGV